MPIAVIMIVTAEKSLALSHALVLGVLLSYIITCIE